MAEFINTIDVLGDDAVVDSIIDRTITEFKDNTLTKVGDYAFQSCAALGDVCLPNVVEIGRESFKGCTSLAELTSAQFPSVDKIAAFAFDGCSGIQVIDLPSLTDCSNFGSLRGTALTSVNLPNLHKVNVGYSVAFPMCENLVSASLPRLEKLSYYGGNSFYRCYNLENVNLSSLTRVGKNDFEDCKKLSILDLPKAAEINANAFIKTSSLIALILRNNAVCTMIANAFDSISAIGNGTGYIYVPRALVDSYKAATNWSTFAAQFRALEDFTVDGTVTGKFKCGTITYNLTAFEASNVETFVLNSSYQTTLTAHGDNPDVHITMDGVDITAEVYNSATGEVMIPTVVGDVVITASSDALLVLYERGAISNTTGAEEPSSTRFRTEAIPFDQSNRTFRADVVANGNTSAKARILVRPYKADGTFISSSFQSLITPAATNNWALSGTDYQFNPGADCAYVRVVISDATETTATSLTGTVTVSGVLYSLAKE
jgi:hypothetical protein